jgi:hypothetical protein
MEQLGSSISRYFTMLYQVLRLCAVEGYTVYMFLISHSMIIVKDEAGRMWQEMVTIYFKT